MAIAERLGFAVNDGDGYVGWADLPGKHEEHIGVIAHVDVVPEGERSLWETDPFKAGAPIPMF